jgi:hypothetical protein
MSGHRRGRAILVVVLCVAVSCAVVFLGMTGDDPDRADAEVYVPSLATTSTVPLTVSLIYPGDGDTGVSPGATFIVEFSGAINPSTLGNSNFYLKKAGSSAKTEAAIAALTSGPPRPIIYPSVRRYTLTPKDDLLPFTKYELTITSGVKSAGGTSLANPRTWSFTTGAGLKIMTLAPAPGATSIPLDQVIAVKFDSGIDLSTVSEDSFYLTEAGDTIKIDVDYGYDPATFTLVLEPSYYDLEPGKSYTATLARGIRGLNAAHPVGVPVSWTFRTAVAATISVRDPEDGAVNVPVYKEIVVWFDRDIDPETLYYPDSFTIGKRGEAPLPAVVGYDPSSHAAVLTPYQSLEEGTVYVLTLSPHVRGADGRPLENSPVTWSFRTSGGVASFTDVAGSPYATAIYDLVDRGIITGFPDGTFKPNDSVSRQQFAKMVVKALAYEVTGSEICPFADVPPAAGSDPLYPRVYVAVCAAHGVTAGKTATSFAPYDAISRQQLVTMLVRAAALASPPASYSPSVTPGQFSSDEHYLNACKAEYAGLLDGIVGLGPSFYFLGASTRAECAQLLYNLHVKLGK